ncbi:MAG: sugar phosphate nucleotidyltransferase [Oscillospiraceae bacterium]|nr:sugar phosphate nucleotidyltransferase [Oscillospiraceae bacterium]
MLQQNASTCAVILAAGEGKRMKSNHPKVLSKVLFKPMLRWVLDAVCDAGVQKLCVVTGFRHEEVESYLQSAQTELADVYLTTALQTERKGTGHAVMMAEEFLKENQGGHVLILSGDAPFLSPELIQDALSLHRENGNAATVISAVLEDPFGYGRIVRDPKTGLLSSIVEEKDASQETKKIKEVNSGAYWFAIDDLLSVLHQISNDNAQGEYYLPDAIKLLLESGKKVDGFQTTDATTVLGANDCLQLNQLNAIARSRILDQLMAEGTEIPCRDGVIIGPDVTVGSHVTILPSTILTGRTVIGSACTIGPNVSLDSVSVADGVTVRFFCADHSRVAASPPPFTAG